MDIIGRTLIGKYKIERLLGQGGMASVWAGTHVGTGRRVAVKVLDDRYLGDDTVSERFGREARAASAVQHEGIVEVLDLDRTDEGLPFLVMELLDGESLGARLLRVGRLDEAATLAVAVPMLEALEAAHARGIVHRDLKPDNVVLVTTPRAGEVPKILDFGISKMADPARAKLTITGAVLGTPHYMSPEQAQGELALDHRVDIYAMGVLLYECLCGVVPFDAPNYNALMRVILDETPAPMASHGVDVRPAMEAAVRAALAKRRDDRPPSARALLDALLAAASTSAGPLPSSLGIDASLAIPSPARRSVPNAPSAPASPPPTAASLPSTPGLSDDDALSPSLALSLDERAMPGPRRGRTASVTADREGAARADASSASTSAPTTPATTGATAPPARPSTLDTNLPTAQPLGERAPASAPPSSRVADAIEGLRDRWDALDDGPRRLVALGGAIVVALLAGVLALRLAVRPSADESTTDAAGEAPTSTAPAPSPPTTTAPAGAPRWVIVDVDGVPPGAMLRLDGLPGATLPLRVRPGVTHELRVQSPGFEEAVERFLPRDDMRLQIHLRAAVGTVRQHP